MFKNGCNLIKIRNKRFRQSMMNLYRLATTQKILDKLKRIKMFVNGSIMKVRNS